MAKIDELNAALSQLATDVQALMAQPKGTSDAELQTVIDNVNSLDAQVKSQLG